MNRGHTLLELALVLLILSLVGGMGVGLSRHSTDRLAVAQAREEAAALFHHARAEARLRGGARVEVGSDGRLALWVGGDEAIEVVDPSRVGVRVEIVGSREEASVVFGPMGIGRAASLTLRFERGRAESSLVISSYGRLRRGP